MQQHCSDQWWSGHQSISNTRSVQLSGSPVTNSMMNSCQVELIGHHNEIAILAILIAILKNKGTRKLYLLDYKSYIDYITNT